MITLTQIKQFLNISPDESSKDELLKNFISNAVSELNTLCSRTLEYSSQIEIISGTGGITLVLENYPAVSIDRIDVLLDDAWCNLFNLPDTFSDSAILLKEVGIIKLLKSYIFPKGELNIKVSYSSGYKCADDWKPGADYPVDELVKYNGSIYKCIEEHTSGEEFDELKWEIDPAKPVSEDIAKAVMYLAAKQFYLSPAGKNMFMKSSESYGDKQTDYNDIDISHIVHTHRNTNI